MTVLVLNGGSSSIKLAAFRADGSVELRERVEHIGPSGAALTVTGPGGSEMDHRSIDASDHRRAAGQIGDWLRARLEPASLRGIGHRVVFGGPELSEHQRVTPRLVTELKRLRPLDPTHLSREIALIEVLADRFPAVPQVACFDSVFHHGMPEVARLLPIPREYREAGVRRYGFHGLSYEYLLEELSRTAGRKAADGRLILAHLGSGASLAAVRAGKPVDTTMAFTPAAGLVMGTRPGDLDPGVLVHLLRSEGSSADALDDLVNRHCGLLGVSETSSDMRDLLERRVTDVRAREAVALFCHQARKWIGAMAAALGGVETLVFAGGIGENAPQVRAETCAGLEFLGVRIDAERNEAGADTISADGPGVVVRVIRTDEEAMVARHVRRVLQGDCSEP